MCEQTTIIDIIRHGEPVGGSKYRGQIDDPLSEKGWAQMRAAVEGRDEWQQIVSSDLSRCAEFARELGASLAVDTELDAGFREVGFGRWEGKSASQLLSEDPVGIAAFWRDPITNTPPGAEPLRDFQRRITEAWGSLIERHAGKRLLLVGHAGMMRILLLHALELPLEAFYRFDPQNASIVRIRIDSGRHGEAYHQLVFGGP
ncbi:MAG: histidine phosphatase family protein [Gammaproteobacteria bacterium]|nr:histidine phosphatase family protein [Gammaproteobacteria bacterium]MCW8993968.1 histidine phosphatase family protein [Gammaproteobacteria bacterium]